MDKLLNQTLLELDALVHLRVLLDQGLGDLEEPNEEVIGGELVLLVGFEINELMCHCAEEFLEAEGGVGEVLRGDFAKSARQQLDKGRRLLPRLLHLWKQPHKHVHQTHYKRVEVLVLRSSEASDDPDQGGCDC